LKKIIFSALLLVVFLVGCEHPTKTIYGAEYIESIKTSKGEILQFKDSEGYKLNYFVDGGDSFNLKKGQRYDVTVSVEDWKKYGDFIVDVKSK
jgi:hypothetical protein